MVGALRILNDMKPPLERNNPNIDPPTRPRKHSGKTGLQISKHYIQKQTHQCKLERNRMECDGETLTKLLQTVSHNKEPYLTHIQRTAKRKRCNRERQNAVNSYVIQILNTKINTAAQKKINQIQAQEILENHECDQCEIGETNPDAKP